MVDFELTDDQKIFVRTFREWCMENLAPRAREIDDKSRIPDEVMDGLASQGILGLSIPEKYGGSGANMVTCGLAVEEVAYADISVATAVMTLLNIGWSLVISKHGTEELKEEILPQVVSGKKYVGIATTEPQGGSDIAGMTSTARLEGDHWIMNGEKAYISQVREMGEKGGGYCTVARTDPSKGYKGMNFIFLPMDLPGIEPTLVHNMGRTGLSTGGFFMKDVKVPVRNTLGEMNKGFYVAMEGFNLARILVASACIGCAQRVLEMGAAYIKERKLFGRPIAKFEGIQFEYSNFATYLEAARLVVRKAAWAGDQFLAGKIDVHQLALAASQAKLFAPIECYNIVDGVMTWFGAYGYSKECEVEMGVRGIRSYSVGAEGAQNVMRLIIGSHLLGPEYSPMK
jgi:acyl-CoA dehydrogenase